MSKLYLPGELTEGQFAVARDFCRLVRIMQDRLSAGIAALDACGLKVETKAAEAVFWGLVDVETPVQSLMLEHIGACVSKLQAASAR